MTTQLALMLRPDETDPNETHRRHVVEAIALAAERNDGVVSQNEVRRILAAMPEWQVPPQVVGSTYRRLILSGHLVAVGWDVSDDVRGGNAGKPCRRYAWTEDQA